MLVGLLFLPYLFRCKRIFLRSKYIVGLFALLLLILFLCIVYSNIIHFTGELEYAKTMLGQFVQFVLALTLLSFLIKKKKIQYVEKYIIISYFIQSVIEIVALMFPSFAQILLIFNRSENLYEGYGGVRGLSLSSAPGWSLALSFGLVYILMAKRFLSTEFNAVDCFIYLVCIVGTLFAGRTGFVGLLYAGIMVVIYKHLNIAYILKVIFLLLLFVTAIYYVALSIPSLYNVFAEQVFPFAFEWYYSMEETGEASTASTDVLMKMWEVLPSFSQFWLGDGWFLSPTGDSYYKKVDVGILRNLFYWGIGGYIVVIYYQVKQLKPLWNDKRDGLYRLMGIIILLYFFTMELKAMTVGFNKMTFSIVILVAFSYLYRTSYLQSYLRK